MIIVLDTRQVADQTDVEEIKLWCFADPLAEIAVIWRKQINDPACFQDGQPAFHGRDTAPQVAGKSGKINTWAHRTARSWIKR